MFLNTSSASGAFSAGCAWPADNTVPMSETVSVTMAPRTMGRDLSFMRRLKAPSSTV